MFKNIGVKIKILATVIFWCGIIGSVFGGFTGIIEGVIDGSSQAAYEGIFIALVGSLSSWACSLLIYGFGQLIENSDKITEELKKEREKE